MFLFQCSDVCSQQCDFFYRMRPSKLFRPFLKTTPLLVALTDAADNWVTECMKEAGRLPNDNEWNRLRTGPLDGKIGMSFALQWRYNFGRLFGEAVEENDVVN
jgi:hypothetical protein